MAKKIECHCECSSSCPRIARLTYANLNEILNREAEGYEVWLITKDCPNGPKLDYILLHERDGYSLYEKPLTITERRRPMWYSTAIKPEDLLEMVNGKAAIIVYRRAFAAHVLYFENTHKVTSHYAAVVNVPLLEFDWWCMMPGAERIINETITRHQDSWTFSCRRFIVEFATRLWHKT